jgi:hypothetical protein
VAYCSEYSIGVLYFPFNIFVSSSDFSRLPKLISAEFVWMINTNYRDNRTK